MAPEIMFCMEFDTSVDIFSFGIILLELVLGIVADSTTPGSSPTIHPLLERVVPGFGVDSEKICESVPEDCPSAFLELALDCAQDNPERRPTMKAILKRLRKIELNLNLRYENQNIGIMTGKKLSQLINRIPTTD